MNHLQLCCVLATAQTRILGKADLPPTLVQLLSCWDCWSCRNEHYLQHYRLCLADILPFDVTIEEADCAQPRDHIPCTVHFLNDLLKFPYCSFSSKTQVFLAVLSISDKSGRGICTANSQELSLSRIFMAGREVVVSSWSSQASHLDLKAKFSMCHLNSILVIPPQSAYS